MKENFHVRFLEGKGGVIPPTYSTKKGFSGLQSTSPASAFLSWDMDAARIPFQAILRAVVCKAKNDSGTLI